MTGTEAHAWCERHAHALEVEHRQGKLHLIVIAQPRPAPPPVPHTTVCKGCGWAGADATVLRSGLYPAWWVQLCPGCGVVLNYLEKP
jgi:hypothetical protein